MTRLSSVLVLVLVASNSAWYLVRATDTSEETLRPRSHREEIARLTSRIPELKRQEQRLWTALASSRPRPVTETTSTKRVSHVPHSPRPKDDWSIAWDLARGWIRDARQSVDSALRDNALDSIYVALGSGDRARIWGALRALALLDGVPYDRGRYRLAILRFLESKDEDTQAQAIRALDRVGPDPSDRLRILALAQSSNPRVQRVVGECLGGYFGRDLTSPDATDAVLKLLADNNRDVVDSALSGMVKSKLSARIEHRVLELFATSEFRLRSYVSEVLCHDPEKSTAVVEALLRALDDADDRIRGDAADGLSIGVPANLHQRVLDRVLRIIQTRTDLTFSSVLERYVDADHVDVLENLLKSASLSMQQRQELKMVIRRVKSPFKYPHH